jgi:hypothetical protein
LVELAEGYVWLEGKMEDALEAEISGTSPLDGDEKEVPAPLFNLSALHIPPGEVPHSFQTRFHQSILLLFHRLSPVPPLPPTRLK